LQAKGGTVRGFVLQDESGNWDWAEGKIDGTDVVLWSKKPGRPKALRYAWADHPIISIENAAGLPLRPFRTAPDANTK
jgi:sialate O-acetylesterase